MSGSDDLGAIITEEAGRDYDIHDTTGPDEIFQTTRARMELALRDYTKIIKSKFRLFNSIVLLLTSLSVLLAANFERTFGLSPDIWYNLFILIVLISFSITIYDALRWLLNREDARTEAVLRELRKDNPDKK